jgi:hypothetical protein
MGSYCGPLYKIVVNWKCKKYFIMEHDLAKDPASPKLSGIWRKYMMHELSFSAHHFRLVRAIGKIVKKEISPLLKWSWTNLQYLHEHWLRTGKIAG